MVQSYTKNPEHPIPRTYPHPRRSIGCCPLLDHISLLAELEADYPYAPWLPRARTLLTGDPDIDNRPWWTK
ncbi:hypothetical protein LCGC14_1779320 [marine sediment metagenome]|uniref:Uncharacterized protein n=1 Tax=marine sediment metagenome TaxID=412755 RepID=A0A0F9HIG6_9ZZZZ